MGRDCAALLLLSFRVSQSGTKFRSGGWPRNAVVVQIEAELKARAQRPDQARDV